MTSEVVICPYCGRKSVLVDGRKVYPHRPDLYSLSFYYCDAGHSAAYVGCHKGTTQPLGRLADVYLRAAKKEAHAAFDPIWRSGTMSRSEAYSWLAKELSIPKKRCHIGMFDLDTCLKVREICAKAEHHD